jgi:FAD/FMN-containing dehydrogenase/Fe-S oxidoreductase
MRSFIEELQQSLQCEVRADPAALSIYSHDASIYEVAPTCIIIPRTKEELLQAILMAKKHAVAVTARGAATGITGGCLGEGLVIDCAQHLNKILSIDSKKRRAIVEPGCIQDDLNNALEPFGLRLGPDTSTGNRATIGGMTANNAAGAHALKFGRMVDHVEELELILASGTIIRFRPLTRDEWQQKCLLQTEEGEIYRTIETIKKNESDLIQAHFPTVERRSSGFNLNELIKSDFSNLCKVIVGSEGTLGVISEVTLSLSEKPKFQALVVLASKNLLQGLEQAHSYMQFKPYALELIDRKIIEAGRLSPSLRDKLSWLQGNPEALFVVEFEADSHELLTKKTHTFHEAIRHESSLLWSHIFFDVDTQNSVWQLRKSGLGLLLSRRGYSRAIAFIEDLVVPPKTLHLFIKELTDYLEAQGKEAGIYGHIADGCLHVRPYMDLRYEKELLFQMMQEVATIVKRYGGSLSAEHGDGRIRSWMNPFMYGDKIYALFLLIKKAFDPENRMNPGLIVNGEEPTHRLHTSPPTSPSFLHFDGGIELHVDLCNGNGQCRKKTGLMCPSFQVTLDEKDSTRGRAHALKAMIEGKVTHDEIHEVMDLCIQCKGCKTECPSQVDMAKLKAEYLFHQRKTLRDLLFGHIGALFRLGSFFPKFSNWLLKRKSLFIPLRITEKRTLPQLSLNRFSALFSPQKKATKKVVLFNDTFTEFTGAKIGLSAQKLLETAGFEVIVLPYHCCGRTLFSKGFLKQAKRKAQKLIDLLLPYAEAGIPIVGLEPSCTFMIRDEFTSFSIEKAETVAKATQTIEELLVSLPLQFKPLEETVLIHGHCHQKAAVGMKAELLALEKIPAISLYDINAGCCGMAGSFGYEKEHYAFSQRIGELKLFQEIRKNPNALVVASGSSCRHQIHDSLNIKPLHLAELLARQLI